MLVRVLVCVYVREGVCVCKGDCVGEEGVRVCEGEGECVCEGQCVCVREREGG